MLYISPQSLHRNWKPISKDEVMGFLAVVPEHGDHSATRFEGLLVYIPHNKLVILQISLLQGLFLSNLWSLVRRQPRQHHQEREDPAIY